MGRRDSASTKWNAGASEMGCGGESGGEKREVHDNGFRG